jgi:hypothetical protein
MFGFAFWKASTIVCRFFSFPPLEMKFEYVIVTGPELSPLLPLPDDEHPARASDATTANDAVAMSDFFM